MDLSVLEGKDPAGYLAEKRLKSYKSKHCVIICYWIGANKIVEKQNERGKGKKTLNPGTAATINILSFKFPSHILIGDAFIGDTVFRNKRRRLEFDKSRVSGRRRIQVSITSLLFTLLSNYDDEILIGATGSRIY